MRFRDRRARSALLAASLAALAFLPLAPVTPGDGVAVTLLASGTAAGGVRVEAAGRTDVAVREIVIAPGGTTGWHYHDGPLVAVVKSGTLTRTLADCGTEVSRAGDSFVEPAGPDRVHTARNLGDEPVVMYVTYVLPSGSPPAVPARDPGCPDEGAAPAQGPSGGGITGVG